MRNSPQHSGVYCNMPGIALFLALAQFAAAQPATQQEPLDAAIQAALRVRGNGPVAPAREQARSLLLEAPPDSPRFAGWAQEVAQLYQNAGMARESRAVLQQALARTAPLGEFHPAHIALLGALGQAWQQDGSLLKAAGLLEQSAEAEAAAPPAPAAPGGPYFAASTGLRTVFGSFAGGGAVAAIYAYMRLSDLYQQLGRPDAVAAIAAKIRALASSNKMLLAQFYEQHGQLEDAAAIYSKMAEDARDPQSKIQAWQSLATLDLRQEHYADAVAAMRKAIAEAQSSDAGGRDQAFWMQQTLANYLRQADMLDEADQLYRQMLDQSRGGPQETQLIGQYAQYLGQTKRTAQGQSLLKDYLANNADLSAPQKMSALFNLSSLSSMAGDSKSAEEYQQSAQALQPQMPVPPASGAIRIFDEVQKAQSVLNHGQLDEAYGMTLRILDMAAQAVDRQQVQSLVPQVANALAAKKEPAKAEQLFQRQLALAQSWSVDRVQPLISAWQSYTRFLMNRPDRVGDVPTALEQYRAVLADANGPDSAALLEPTRLKIEFERRQSQWDKAEADARELMAAQQSFSGNTSEPYLSELRIVANVYSAAGEDGRALPLLREAVTIADLLATPNNKWRQSQTRNDAALTLARLGQFDEAMALAKEALTLQPPVRGAAPRSTILAQIQQMKQTAEK